MRILLRKFMENEKSGSLKAFGSSSIKITHDDYENEK